MKRTFANFEDTEKVEAWSERNELRPCDVSMSADLKVWFTCARCGHDFLSRVAGVSSNGRWCPFCSGNQICDDARECAVCITKTFFSHEDKDKVDAWSDRNEKKPWEVTLSSGQLIIFDCKSCGHTFKTKPNKISSQGSWCKYCANMVLCDNPRECSICIVKTFYAFEDKTKLDSWSDRNSKKPWQVFRNSAYKAWFDCGSCGHSFGKILNTVVDRSWCPYCAHRKLCNSQECTVCVAKSFYGYEDKDRVESWSKRNRLKSWQVFMNSQIKHWFDCRTCGHVFDRSPGSIVRGNNWCPYCSSNRLCADARECKSCLLKTFYAFENKAKVLSWSKKNDIMPWQVFKHSKKKVWFDCSKCVSPFRSAVEKVSIGRWCPRCSTKRNRAMEKLMLVLDEHGAKYVLEQTVKLSGRSLHWDISCVVNDVDFAIESDGQQHFSLEGIHGVSRGKLDEDQAIAKFQDQRARDLLKKDHIRETGGLLFRFSYRQTAQIESLVATMLEHVTKGTKGVVYMDSIYWNT